ncbi:T9SS type A sorting domain-containing protein [uncultured Flavobacterium sp.]|uniref:T9SS type A sorting domain-containing protein n=1 Tax=uncultured Flavobacterium sp. TaxID=165435 RepID=UPI0025F0B4CD|nr:T9SS type A sorting domain-containing protein [uncultured Flavobacterium sp.]
MKQKIVITALLACSLSKAQSVIQTVNSGSVISSQSSISVGEIIVVPENQTQSNSGIIGILATNQQTLEVPQFEIAKNIIVYPNPTVSKIFFETKESLSNENVTVFNNAGQKVLSVKLNSDNSLDLTALSNGIYLIQFSNKKFKPFKIIKH